MLKTINPNRKFQNLCIGFLKSLQAKSAELPNKGVSLSDSNQRHYVHYKGSKSDLEQILPNILFSQGMDGTLRVYFSRIGSA